MKEPSGQAAADSSSDASKDSTTAASTSSDSSTPSSGSTTSTTSQDVKNPQTSAGTPVMITVLPIVAGMLLIVTFMFNKN